MKYQKNGAVDFMEIDDENIVVYDPDSGDTHYIESTGKVILDLLDEPAELDALISALCEAYSAERAEIEADVKEFLAELEAKKVVVSL